MGLDTNRRDFLKILGLGISAPVIATNPVLSAIFDENLDTSEYKIRPFQTLIKHKDKIYELGNFLVEITEVGGNNFDIPTTYFEYASFPRQKSMDIKLLNNNMSRENLDNLSKYNYSLYEQNGLYSYSSLITYLTVRDIRNKKDTSIICYINSVILTQYDMYFSTHSMCCNVKLTTHRCKPIIEESFIKDANSINAKELFYMMERKSQNGI